jgi:hypothetical protein
VPFANGGAIYEQYDAGVSGACRAEVIF